MEQDSPLAGGRQREGQTVAPALPRDALGVGLRPAHYREFCRSAQQDCSSASGMPHYLEILTDNFLSAAAGPKRVLRQVAQRYPLVLHGVGLNLLGHEALDLRYLDAVAALAEQVQAPFVTDHLCWTAAAGLQHHDLLPVPYVEDLVALAAERAAFVQAHLGRPFGLENLSSYATFAASTMSEQAFYTRVVRQSGCYYMLDINNIYVSACNAGFEPLPYLQAIDYDRVLQVHLAGHATLPDGGLIDTHDQPVCDAVWALYAEAWRLGGPFPTLVEWDAQVPPLGELLGQLQYAQQVQAGEVPLAPLQLQPQPPP